MERRLKKELAFLAANAPEGISCYPVEEGNVRRLSVSIQGPVKSAYEGSHLDLEIDIPLQYPIEPPKVKFLTKVYHPNIDESGHICLDLLKMPPTGNWNPTITLGSLFEAIQFLLKNPNSEDPLMPEIAEEYKYDTKEFFRKAKKLMNNTRRS